MRSEEIIAALNKIFEELFEIDPALLKPEALFVEDLGMDSLDAVDLIVAIEKEFGVRVKEEDARAIRTLGDIYNAVEKRFITSEPDKASIQSLSA
jgi:acyl carrier protein